MKRGLLIRLAIMCALAFVVGQSAAPFGPPGLIVFFMIFVAGATFGHLSGWWHGRHGE